MNHGDLIEVRYRWNRRCIVRYRVDPIPHTGFKCFGKRNFYAWYKKPRTTQERKWSLVDKKYVRNKRNMRNLPNVYDDIIRSDKDTRRSWKNKKIEKQWQKNSGCNSRVEDQTSNLIMGVQFPPPAPKGLS